jgi:predicted transposase/invertase (TIGR01784 family)
MICLGQKQYTELEGLLRLLNLVLVDNSLNQQEKKNKLAEEFSIRITPGLERGVTEMCNLSEGVERRGIEKGIEKGMVLGLAEGRVEGRAEGRAEVAIELLKEKLSIEMIARATKLTVEQVKEIGKKNALI